MRLSTVGVLDLAYNFQACSINYESHHFMGLSEGLLSYILPTRVFVVEGGWYIGNWRLSKIPVCEDLPRAARRGQ